MKKYIAVTSGIIRRGDEINATDLANGWIPAVNSIGKDVEFFVKRGLRFRRLVEYSRKKKGDANVKRQRINA
jgi:hypothetical protein